MSDDDSIRDRDVNNSARFWIKPLHPDTEVFHTIPHSEQNRSEQDTLVPSDEERKQVADKALDQLGVDHPMDPLRRRLKRGEDDIRKFHYTRVADTLKSTTMRNLTGMTGRQIGSIDNLVSLYVLKEQAEDRHRIVYRLLHAVDQGQPLGPSEIMAILEADPKGT